MPLLGVGRAMLGACREPDPAANPGVSLGLAIGDAGEGRPRQADVPGRRRDRGVRGVGRAAHRREHRQARRRDRPGRPRAARAGRRLRHGPGRSSGSPLARRPTDGGRDALADALEAAGHPVIRIDDRRPDRPRRRVRPLGGGDGDRRDRPRHRPVRPAERRGGQGADARRSSSDGRAIGARRRTRPARADREPTTA